MTSTGVEVLDWTVPAGTVLTGHQYLFCQLGTSTWATQNRSTTHTAFILQNKPSTGEAARIRLLGVSRLRVACTVYPGEPLISGTSGWGTFPEKAAQWDSALAMGSGANGNYVEVLCSPFSRNGGTTIPNLVV